MPGESVGLLLNHETKSFLELVSVRSSLVPDRLLDGIGVDVGAKLVVGFPGLDQRRAGEGDLGCIRQSGVDGSTQRTVLGAVGLIRQHDDLVGCIE